MKILILGNTGILGTYICKHGQQRGNTILFPGSANINRPDYLNPNSVLAEIERIKPDVVINCAAITSFERCENFPDEAYQVNTLTPYNISNFCMEKGFYFIHISTDHYYIDAANSAHSESDPVSVLNHYARTKFDAELKVLENSNALVLRTSVIGRNKQNSSFLDWLINAINSNQKIDLFDDAFTSFIHCNELAPMIFNIMNSRPAGLYNLASSEVFSKADFAVALAKRLKCSLNYALKSVETLSVKRANSCGLNSSKISTLCNVNLPNMLSSVEAAAIEWEKKSSI